MKPIEFKEQNMVYQKPASMTEEQCGSLPVHKYEEGIISCWKMSFKERIKALLTGIIWFCVLSPTQPPIWLDVESPFIPQSDEDVTHG